MAAALSGEPASESEIAFLSSIVMTRSTEIPLNLTSGRLLARNTIWNLLGQILPIPVAAIAVPIIVRGMGLPRFGILSIALIVVGYVSFFDLGIGRALTKLVAERIGTLEAHKVPVLIWTSLFLLLLLGVAGAVVTRAISPWLVGRVLKIPAELRTETLHGFYLMAVSIPLVTLTAGWRGVLEAMQRFQVLNLIRLPTNIFSFAGPLLVLPFSHSLVAVLGVLLVGRFAGLLAHQYACYRALPGVRENIGIDCSLVPLLVRTGGWLTVSSLVGPVILNSDRLIIGTLLPVSFVSYYTASCDMVVRFLVIPTAIAGVLFPAFAGASREAGRVEVLLSRGVKYIFLVMFPLTLFIVIFAPEILRVWLGVAFAENSSSVLRWLAVGIFINSMSMVPFALLQGVGRADVAAKVLMIELPVFVLGAWLLVAGFGIKGAAMAWFARAALENLVFSALSQKYLAGRVSFLKFFGAGVAVALCILYAGTLASGIIAKSAFLAGGFLVFAWIAWFHVLEAEERVFWARRGASHI